MYVKGMLIFGSQHHVLKMPDGTIWSEWLKSVKKEAKALSDIKTFLIDE
jgi:hypothetical protein